MEFQYKAKNEHGNVQAGKVKAADEAMALDILKQNNLDVFSIKPIKEKKAGFSAEGLTGMLNAVSEKDIVIFSRQLSVLIQSNIPIVRALGTLSEQTSNPKMVLICKKMGKMVEEGSSFSEALNAYPKQFDNFYVSVVKSGETSGNLQRSLNYLADHVEKDYELKRKVKGAMMYPAVIIFAFCGVFFFLTVKVLPQLTDILKESEVELPWTTKIVITVSDFMSTNWMTVLVMIAAAVVGMIYYFKSEDGKKNLDLILFKSPLIGVLIRYVYITRFAENLRVLLEEGVSIVKAFAIMAEVMDNVIYRGLIVKIMREVEKGKSMTEPMLEEEEAFPRMVPQMLKIGEETGDTVKILKNIENFYGKEVDNITNNLTTIIEPILIIILGVGTGLLVGAIMMPIYDMASAI
jgi:type IV pilus assembly protein PilC